MNSAIGIVTLRIICNLSAPNALVLLQLKEETKKKQNKNKNKAKQNKTENSGQNKMKHYSHIQYSYRNKQTNKPFKSPKFCSFL